MKRYRQQFVPKSRRMQIMLIYVEVLQLAHTYMMGRTKGEVILITTVIALIRHLNHCSAQSPANPVEQVTYRVEDAHTSVTTVPLNNVMLFTAYLY